MGAFTFRVNANVADVTRYLDGIQKDLRPKAIVPSLNKTATKVKTEVVRKLSKERKIKQKTLREQIKINKALRATSKLQARNYAVVDASEAKTINLINFVTPGKRKINYFNKVLGKGKKRKYRSSGVIANTGKGRKVYKGTFIAKNKDGDLRVFKRKGKAKDKIYMVSGARPGKYFKLPETHAFMRKVSERQFPIELNRAVKAILARKIK